MASNDSLSAAIDWRSTRASKTRKVGEPYSKLKKLFYSKSYTESGYFELNRAITSCSLNFILSKLQPVLWMICLAQ